MFQSEHNHYYNYCSCHRARLFNESAHRLVVAVSWYATDKSSVYPLRMDIYKMKLEEYTSRRTAIRPVKPSPPRFPAWWEVPAPFSFGGPVHHFGLFTFGA